MFNNNKGLLKVSNLRTVRTLTVRDRQLTTRQPLNSDTGNLNK